MNVVFMALNTILGLDTKASSFKTWEWVSIFFQKMSDDGAPLYPISSNVENSFCGPRSIQFFHENGIASTKEFIPTL